VFRARFVSECKLAAAIDHPNVVQIFHAGEERGVLYVTMRYIDGTDLRTLLAEVGRLPPERAVRIIAQVAGALDAAHARGLVHRDVKPANVLLAERDGGEKAYLTDFGVTKERSASGGLTKTGFAVGTADYMAPEQARGGDVDGRADIYALGCVLYRALTGEVLYERDSDVEKMWAHIHDPPPQLLDVRPELPRGLGAVLDRALAKHPDDRQRSAAELAEQALASLAA
jgi:serine/threonine protein kinase